MNEPHIPKPIKRLFHKRNRSEVRHKLRQFTLNPPIVRHLTYFSYGPES